MSVQVARVITNVLVGNDQVAQANQATFEAAGVLAVNLLGSPGAGKTSLIVRTMAALRDHGRGCGRIGVIEGDIAGSIDAEKVLEAGADAAVQINTGGNCHLEANMVQRALGEVDLGHLDIVFIENVGNLVCPTHWALGEGLRLCLASTAEGHDKPVKYPDIFARSDVVVLNKTDLAELVDFDRDFFYRSLRGLNPTAPVFEVSCRTGAGIIEWAGWLSEQRGRVGERQTVAEPVTRA
jgi:hydrogenase nickel incorporation protein HypB